MGLMNTTQMPEFPPPPRDVTILKHCRCVDCRHFHRVGGRYVCDRNVGGTGVVWATGEHVCNPKPEQWHYCACYHGPQISKDVWAWPKAQHRVVEIGPNNQKLPYMEQKWFPRQKE